METGLFYLGVDIGGTKTNIGLIDDNGNIISHKTINTSEKFEDPLSNFTNIAYVAKQFYDEVSNKIAIESIGIGIPGTVDHKKGKIVFAPNLNCRNLDIKNIFKEFFKAPVYIGQDTEAAAIAEHLYGAGKGIQNMVCITIGTGIGSGIIMNNKLYKGEFETAGEIGHIIVKKGGAPCSCGRRGCLEAYSSGKGILNNFLEEVANGKETILKNKLQSETIRTEDIFNAAKNGDKLSQEIIDNATDFLSIGIVNLINLLSPEKIILSGGLSRERELFVNPIIEKAYSNMYSILKDKVKIEIAKLGEFAPMIGAAMLFKNYLFTNIDI